MKISKLEELGFEKLVMSDNYDLKVSDKIELNYFRDENFITMYVNDAAEIELYNVNTIEKVKQLIELLK